MLNNDWKWYLLNKFVLRDSVSSAVATVIENGEYSEDRKIKAGDFAKKLKLSQTPVRESFELLAVLGVLTYTPRYGYYVATFTERMLENLYAARRAVEIVATRFIAQNITPKQAKALQKHFRTFMLSIGKKREKDILLADRELHIAYYTTCSNEYIGRMCIALWANLLNLRHYVSYKSLWGKRIVQEYREIITAVTTRNSEKAVILVEEYLRDAEMSLQQVVHKQVKRYAAPK